MALTIFQSIAYYQNSDVAMVWIDKNVDLDLLGFHVPVAWFNSIDPLVSIIAVPVLVGLWRWQSSHGREPLEIGKIAIGAWLACLANLLLVIGCLTSERVPVLYPIAYDTLLGIAFLYYWPTLLALVSRAAPAGLKATLMGVVFLSIFLANITIGWLGAFYERMTPAEFWGMHAAIAATGAILAMFLARPLNQIFRSGAQTSATMS